jgi:hypothetical protein
MRLTASLSRAGHPEPNSRRPLKPEKSQSTKSTTTSYSKDCIFQCAKAGSPLGILTADGATYLPVTTIMPDMGQEQLKPYVVEIVEAKGKAL